MIYNYSIDRKRLKRSISIKNIYFLLISIFLFSCNNSENHKSKPPVYLNHIILILDSQNYNDLRNSDFIKKYLAHKGEGTVKSDSTDSWTSMCYWGKDTYIECFDIEKIEWERGNLLCGIVFGIEEIGGIESLYKSLNNSLKPHYDKATRHFKTDAGDEVPYFHYLISNKTDSNSIITSFVMEYPDTGVGSIKRELNNQYKYNKNLLLENIIEVELLLPELDIKKMMEELTSFGYEIKQNEEKVFAKGPQINFVIRSQSDNKKGITRIKLSLTNNEHKNQTITLSKKSKIVINSDKTADWYFGI